jgi:hypothetical protein
MNKSDGLKSFATAMCLFQGEVKNPPKSAENPFFKSRYTTLDTLIDTAKPLLMKNGLSYLQSCSGDGSNIIVTTLLMHNSGEWIESDPLTLKADKATAQGAGSAITYARRYALAAALGLASDEDDDGNGAEGDKAKKSQNPPQDNKPVGNDSNKTEPQQGGKNDSGASDTISEAQAKRMFALSQGSTKEEKADNVRLVIKSYGYEKSTNVKKVDYEKICKELSEMPF